MGPNKAQVRAEMQERADGGEFEGLWMSHETDEPLRVAFPNGWGEYGGDGLGTSLNTLESYIVALYYLS